MEREEQTILVVDDNPTNLDVAVNYLAESGFRVITARNGESGLKKAQLILPDMILLDILMPGIDGFEVCRQLKANDTTREIPVVFMTALADTKHKVEGFGVGAVDYVTKPIQQEEMLARVMTHLKIRNLTRQLQKDNADKDKFFSIVAHDLKGPFMPLIGNAELLIELADALPPSEVRQMGVSIRDSGKRMVDLLENLLTWARLQMGRMECQPELFNLQEVVKKNISLLADIAVYKQVILQNNVKGDCVVYGDEHMIDTVIRNLINNALKFSLPMGQVTVSSTCLEETVLVAVADTGGGIKQEDIAKLFKVGSQHTTTGTAKEKGTGLGLIMCQEMIERNNGQIWLESELGKGTVVKFTVPAK